MPPFDQSLIPAEPDLSFEFALWEQGLTAVAGIDEAGRGALAGPVSSAAVILPPDMAMLTCLKGVRDSKQLTPEQREIAREKILKHAVAWGVGFATSDEIDYIGILPATRLAACRALAALYISPAHILLDFIFLPEVMLPQTALIKGDCRSLSIAAASILAKTARDAVLRELDLSFPGYGFAAHKGYGTNSHRAALQRLGASPVHRQSFTLFRAPDHQLDGYQLKPD
jgi:ribonuclease HII